MVVDCLLAAIVKIKCCLVSSVHKVAYNGLGLGEVAEIEKQKYQNETEVK